MLPNDDELDPTLRELARDYHEPPPVPRDAMWARIQAARAVASADSAAAAAPAASPAPAATPAVIDLDQARRRRRRLVAWLAGPVGVAAVLLLGVWLGRVTVDAGPSGSPVATVDGPSPAGDPSPAAVEPAPTLAALDTAAPDPTGPTAGAIPRTGRSPRAARLAAAPEAGSPARPDRSGDATFRLAAIQHLSQSEAFLTLFRASVQGGGNEQLASATARRLLAANRLLLDSPAGRDVRTQALLRDLERVLAQITQLRAEDEELERELILDDLNRSDVLFRIRASVPAGSGLTQSQGVS